MVNLIKKFLQILILSFAVIGFLSVGGKDFLITQYNNFFGNSEENLMKRASMLGDFSQISEEYTIDRAASAFGYKGVLAEHNASGQKIFIIKSDKNQIITVDDFNNGEVESKINSLIRKFRYQSLQIDDFTITKKGTMVAYGKNVPYVRFTAKINKLPIGTIGGVVSAVDLNNDDSRTIVALNENKKYSQLITNEFFKKVK
ncbi:hypothetical protein IJG72_01410 [bacterium]|nr:hypothetical protein [bacterium]